MNTYHRTSFLQFIIERAGPYAWWMFGTFILSVGLLLAPSNIVVPILRDYSSLDPIPGLAILRAYYAAASRAQILYFIAIGIAVLIQVFFIAKTVKNSLRHTGMAIALTVIFMSFYTFIIINSGVPHFDRFITRVSQDIQQFENDELETAIIHISPRDLTVHILGPLDPLVNYSTPVARFNGIRPSEGMGWEGFTVPLQMEFERNTDREFSDARSVPVNLAEAQLYKVTFTSNMYMIYSIEEVTQEYFLAQRPLPEPRNVGDIDPAFFGTWFFDDDASWSMTFHENGGGLRGYADDQQFFSWGLVGDVLSISYEPEMGRVRSESWDFEIDGDRLVLVNRRGTANEHSYTRK